MKWSDKEVRAHIKQERKIAKETGKTPVVILVYHGAEPSDITSYRFPFDELKGTTLDLVKLLRQQRGGNNRYAKWVDQRCGLKKYTRIMKKRHVEEEGGDPDDFFEDELESEGPIGIAVSLMCSPVAQKGRKAEPSDHVIFHFEWYYD